MVPFLGAPQLIRQLEFSPLKASGLSVSVGTLNSPPSAEGARMSADREVEDLP